MGLTENATIVYLGTDMGDLARKYDFERFHSAWCSRIITLSNAKEGDDLEICNAMKSISSNEFYYDANRD